MMATTSTMVCHAGAIAGGADEFSGSGFPSGSIVGRCKWFLIDRVRGRKLVYKTERSAGQPKRAAMG